MNLGIYVPTLRNQEFVKDIFDAINYGIDNDIISDASVFFDDISYNEHPVKCGLFNSSDIWNFSGVLVTTSLSTTLSALKIVNNIDLHYYYGTEDSISPLSLIYLLSGGTKVICDSEISRQDLYRKTGKNPISVCENFYELLTAVKK